MDFRWISHEIFKKQLFQRGSLTFLWSFKSAVRNVTCKHRGACMCVDVHTGACMFGLSFKERSILGDQPKTQPVANKSCKDFKCNPAEIH